jgi:hypothetical protein
MLDVLPRKKFARKLAAAGLSATQLTRRYALLATQMIPADIHATIQDDPDDDVAHLRSAPNCSTDVGVFRVWIMAPTSDIGSWSRRRTQNFAAECPVRRVVKLFIYVGTRRTMPSVRLKSLNRQLKQQARRVTNASR